MAREEKAARSHLGAKRLSLDFCTAEKKGSGGSLTVTTRTNRPPRPPAMYITAMAAWMHVPSAPVPMNCLTSFIERERAFSGSQFLQALVFGWLKRPHATLEHLAHSLGISRQALDQRWTPKATTFCQTIFKEAVNQVFQTPANDRSSPFEGVFLDDGTHLKLPDACADDYPGCGSGLEGQGKSGMKVLTRSRSSAANSAISASTRLGPPTRRRWRTLPNCPRAVCTWRTWASRDFERLQSYDDKGIYFINRVPVQTRLPAGTHPKGIPLAELLKQRRQRRGVDRCRCHVGQQGLCHGTVHRSGLSSRRSRSGYGSWRRTPSGGTGRSASDSVNCVGGRCS